MPSFFSWFNHSFFCKLANKGKPTSTSTATTPTTRHAGASSTAGQVAPFVARAVVRFGSSHSSRLLPSPLSRCRFCIPCALARPFFLANTCSLRKIRASNQRHTTNHTALRFQAAKQNTITSPPSSPSPRAPAPPFASPPVPLSSWSPATFACYLCTRKHIYISPLTPPARILFPCLQARHKNGNGGRRGAQRLVLPSSISLLVFSAFALSNGPRSPSPLSFPAPNRLASPTLYLLPPSAVLT